MTGNSSVYPHAKNCQSRAQFLAKSHCKKRRGGIFLGSQCTNKTRKKAKINADIGNRNASLTLAWHWRRIEEKAGSTHTAVASQLVMARSFPTQPRLNTLILVCTVCTQYTFRPSCWRGHHSPDDRSALPHLWLETQCHLQTATLSLLSNPDLKLLCFLLLSVNCSTYLFRQRLASSPTAWRRFINFVLLLLLLLLLWLSLLLLLNNIIFIIVAVLDF